MDFILNAISVARKKHATNLTIGQLIEKLECLDCEKQILLDQEGFKERFLYLKNLYRNEEEYYKETYGEEEQQTFNISMGFGSYRGYYEDLYIDVTDEENTITVKDLLLLLDQALSKGEMYGYKGGDYTIDKNTLLWFSKYSECFGVFPTDVIEFENKAIIITKHEE